MDENRFTQLEQEVKDLNNKLDAFLNIYKRSDFPDQYVFNKKVVLNNQNLDTQGNMGMKIGNSSSKLSVYGKTPVVQASAISTVSGSAGGTYGATEQGIINNLVTAVNAANVAIKNYGITQ